MYRKEIKIAECLAEDCNYFGPDERAEYERWLDSLAAPEIDFPETDEDLPF